jgi:hypothetical protein
MKETIIVGGRNYYPQDLEAAVADVAGLRPGRVVAIAVPNEERGTEDVVVAAEVLGTGEDGLDALAHAVRSRLATVVGLTARDVALLPRGEVPVTSSGKLQRRMVRDAYLAGTLRRLVPGASAPRAGAAADGREGRGPSLDGERGLDRHGEGGAHEQRVAHGRNGAPVLQAIDARPGESRAHGELAVGPAALEEERRQPVADGGAAHRARTLPSAPDAINDVSRGGRR